MREPYGLTVIFALSVLLMIGIDRARADNPTETVVGGQVVNSTNTFSGAGTSGPGNLNLDGTTIQNLNSLNPPVTLQLILSSITYTEASVTGDGATPSITFDITPTLGNVGNNLPSTEITLFAPGPIANGVTDTDVVFSLRSPVVFAPVAEMNPGNGNEGNGGIWQESLSNLEPNPDEITTSGGVFVPGSVQNSDFTFGGSVEVVYQAIAAPEPRSGWLAILAISGFATLIVARRYSKKA